MHVNQEHVATTYDLGLLSLGDLTSAAQSILSPLTSGVGLATSDLGALASKVTSLPTSIPSALVSDTLYWIACTMDQLTLVSF